MTISHIIPAIIPDSYDRLESELSLVQEVAPLVQVDIMDGSYTPKASWPYNKVDFEKFEALKREEQGFPYWEDVDIEIDLMVREPETCVEDWILAGASTLIVHVETTTKLEDIFALCTERSVAVALALKPSTDIELLAPYIDRATFVQCMGSDEIGRHSVVLDPKVYDQIRAIKARWPDTIVGVDIGVSEKTLPKLIEAGATRFAAGSAVFENGDPKERFEHLTTLVQGLLHAGRAE